MTLRQLASLFSRYLASGAATTLTAYVIFMVAAIFVHYALASFLAWTMTIPVGFALNRKFTFRIGTADRRAMQFLKFCAGAVLQLVLNEACLFVFIGQLELSKTMAFVLTLAITATVNFAFLAMYAFRQR